MTATRPRASRRAASEGAVNTPCVRCERVPTVGTAYGYEQAHNGRVCHTHATLAIDEGTMVALDDGGVKNFGARR